MRATLRRIGPNFFAIPFGLAGLGAVWRLMAERYHAPGGVADALLGLAAIAWLTVMSALLARGPRQFVEDLRDSGLSPFLALAFIVPIVIAGGIASDLPFLAKTLFVVAVVPAAVMGGLLTGQWIAADVDQAKAHPGYFLPTVAGGFLAAQVAAQVGLRSLGMLCFGVGVICWFVLGSLILNRLVFRATLAQPLLPTLAIEVAPPCVAGGAYFALHSLRADAISYALAGYAILMVLVQLRLLPLYLRLRFTPGFWAFTFSWCAVANLALRWIGLEHPGAQTLLAWLACAGATALVASIAVRSGVAAARRELLPRPVASTTGRDRPTGDAVAEAT